MEKHFLSLSVVRDFRKAEMLIDLVDDVIYDRLKSLFDNGMENTEEYIFLQKVIDDIFELQNKLASMEKPSVFEIEE